ncbi:NADH-quinone oxidoreductase subunit M [Phormidium sp. CLA17]|uniref:NADH-quinone oxidoreductase subunit M n=1 Tax=Leptolyngbya sp. Cla-17 TaxID=2803751 RepID=UPI0014911E5C|nr:NADH-quinone oxidoreductase subunit M [Leptolyngbya sp. Cla-17]MBM0742539.1 NADH-quinone oxidoreductase subunit M [Leptolyngbya sp. Cla-17]
MLSALVWIPVLGVILIGLLPRDESALARSLPPNSARFIALSTSAITFALSIVLALQFDSTSLNSQFQEWLPWIEPLGLNYQLGLDGLSLPLVVLNGLLTWIAIYSTEKSIQRPRLYYILVLLLNTGVAGAFLSGNLLLFFLFYELELIPLYFLIAIWGGAQRGYAATKFLIYTAVSGILILTAFLGIVWLSQSTTFDYAEIHTESLPMPTQFFLLGLLLVGFGIKIPLLPFHTWLPDAHVEASTPISVLLAGVLLKLGTYGLLRFGLGLLPESWAVLAPWLATWAVVSVLYGAFTAIAQTDMKKMVAYSSIAHMGYVLLAAAAATPLSVLGTVFQMVSHGLISAMLFLLVGVVYKKTGTRDITVLQGLLTPEQGMPIIGSLMVIGVMASAGIPGMMGFMSEFLIFRGSFPIFPVQTLISMIGTGLTAVYFLLLVNRTFFGRLPQQFANLPRVYWSERLPAFALALLIVVLGLQPNWLARWSETTMTALLTPATAIAITPKPPKNTAIPFPSLSLNSRSTATISL